MRNLEMLIVSAVKISKQCLQTASAPYWSFAPGSHWENFVPNPLGYSFPKNKNSWRRDLLRNVSNAAALTAYSGGASHGLETKAPHDGLETKPHMSLRHSPTMKDAGHESGGDFN